MRDSRRVFRRSWWSWSRWIGRMSLYAKLCLHRILESFSTKTAKEARWKAMTKQTRSRTTSWAVMRFSRVSSMSWSRLEPSTCLLCSHLLATSPSKSTKMNLSSWRQRSWRQFCSLRPKWRSCASLHFITHTVTTSHALTKRHRQREKAIRSETQWPRCRSHRHKSKKSSWTISSKNSRRTTRSG